MSSQSYQEKIARYTLELYEAEYSDRHLLQGAISKWATETPDKVAIHEVNTGTDYTYAQFDELSTAYALKLVEMGFQPGDFLATMLPLLAEHIFLEYACFKIGLVHTPLDLRLKIPEVVRSLGLVEPKGFAFLGKFGEADFSAIGKAVKEECDYIESFIQFSPGEHSTDGAISIEQFVADAKALFDDKGSEIWKRYQEFTDAVKPTDGAQVIYTTGSTGFPKPALLSHQNITAQNLCLAAGFEMDDGMTMLVHLPPSHVGCQAEQLITTFFTGGSAAVMHIFDAELTLKAIEKYKVNCFGQVPAMFNMQWIMPNFEDYDLSSVETVMYGGQTVTEQFVQQLVNRFPKVRTGLGLSEMAGFVTYTSLDATVDDLVKTVGWSMPITPLTIRRPMNEDGSAGEELPDGETGEICFSGPQVFLTYVNNEEAYKKTVSTDGICYTGDLGYKSDRGLVFCGRSKLVIKPKGYQVHPAQIEQHFAQLEEQVAACGAVGVYHDIFSEGVVLFVETKTSGCIDAAQLAEHAKEIAGYMRPSHYILLEPGTFPLNRVAKTDYVHLGELAKQEIENLRSNGGWDASSN